MDAVTQVCRDGPDSGNNTEKAELEIEKLKGCVHEGCGKEGLN